uniref:Breast cancer metastasis-suppressor 1-like protein-A n=1 Tax=Aceria tosichella TaxID=561515 RepID=A0A6G1SD52_9ACAR
MTNNSEKDSISTSKDQSDQEDNETSSGSSSSSSSEIDEEESERRKALIMNDMSELERQFVNLREQLYQARRERVISKLDEVKAGKAPEYLQPLEDLQDQMRIRTEVAGILKELRLKNIRCQYDAEQLAVKQNYDSERRAIIDNIRFDIEEKLRHLDEDKNALEYNETPVEHFGLTRDHLFLPDRRRKPVSITGPYIIYLLRDHEIMEDHAQIRKAIQISLARDCA